MPELQEVQKHEKSRLQYAQNHINKPQKLWDSVLWGDETKQNGFVYLEEKNGWQDGCIEVSGNPWRKPHAVSEEAEAWVSWDLPTGQ